MALQGMFGNVDLDSIYIGVNDTKVLNMQPSLRRHCTIPVPQIVRDKWLECGEGETIYPNLITDKALIAG